MPRGKRNKSKPNTTTTNDDPSQNESNIENPIPSTTSKQQEDEELKVRLASAKQRLEKVQQVIDKIGTLQESTNRIINESGNALVDVKVNKGEKTVEAGTEKTEVSNLTLEENEAENEGSQTLKKKRNRNRNKNRKTNEAIVTPAQLDKGSSITESNPEKEPQSQEIKKPLEDETKASTATSVPSNQNTAARKRNKKNKNKKDLNQNENQTLDSKNIQEPTKTTMKEPKAIEIKTIKNEANDDIKIEEIILNETIKDKIKISENIETITLSEDSKKDEENAQIEENSKSCQKLWDILDEATIKQKTDLKSECENVANPTNSKKRNKKKNNNSLKVESSVADIPENNDKKLKEVKTTENQEPKNVEQKHETKDLNLGIASQPEKDPQLKTGVQKEEQNDLHLEPVQKTLPEKSSSMKESKQKNKNKGPQKLPDVKPSVSSKSEKTNNEPEKIETLIVEKKSLPKDVAEKNSTEQTVEAEISEQKLAEPKKLELNTKQEANVKIQEAAIKTEVDLKSESENPVKKSPNQNSPKKPVGKQDSKVKETTTNVEVDLKLESDTPVQNSPNKPVGKQDSLKNRKDKKKQDKDKKIEDKIDSEPMKKETKDKNNSSKCKEKEAELAVHKPQNEPETKILETVEKPTELAANVSCLASKLDDSKVKDICDLTNKPTDTKVEELAANVCCLASMADEHKTEELTTNVCALTNKSADTKVEELATKVCCLTSISGSPKADQLATNISDLTSKSAAPKVEEQATNVCCLTSKLDDAKAKELVTNISGLTSKSTDPKVEHLGQNEECSAKTLPKDNPSKPKEKLLETSEKQETTQPKLADKAILIPESTPKSESPITTETKVIEIIPDCTKKNETSDPKDLCPQASSNKDISSKKPEFSPKSKDKKRQNQKSHAKVEDKTKSKPEIAEATNKQKANENQVKKEQVKIQEISSDSEKLAKTQQKLPDSSKSATLKEENKPTPEEPLIGACVPSNLEESFTILDADTDKDKISKSTSNDFVDVPLTTTEDALATISTQSKSSKEPSPAPLPNPTPVAKERSKSKKEQKQNRKKSASPQSVPPDKSREPSQSKTNVTSEEYSETDSKNVQGSDFAQSANQIADQAKSLGHQSNQMRDTKNPSPTTNKRNKDAKNLKQSELNAESKTRDIPEKNPQEKIEPQCSEVSLVNILDAKMTLPSDTTTASNSNRKMAKTEDRKKQKSHGNEQISDANKPPKLDINSNEISKPESGRVVTSPQPKKALPPLPPLLDEDEEFIEYQFTPREVFVCTVCQICKKNLNQDIVQCKLCQMVFYCSEEHLLVDQTVHSTLCRAIQEIAKKRGGHVYNNARILSDDDFRCLRVHTLNTCENMLKRQLQPYEREILLFPRLCATNTCREWRLHLLEQCKNCGQVSYCQSNNDHLPTSHNDWCKVFQLYTNLVIRQKVSGRIEPSLPSKIMSKPYNLTATIDEVFKDLYRNYGAIKDECIYATLTQLATAPLTAYYGSQKSEQLIGETYTIHLVGAELQFEADTLDKWETFFLHLVPQLVELRVVFIGPELNMENLPLEILSRMRMCRTCRQHCRAVKFDFQCGKLYHDYGKSAAFIKPDLVCFFNAGLYRLTGFNGVDTWPDTIQFTASLNCPIVITSYTEIESPKDLERLQKEVKRELVIFELPTLNPYTSQRPERNFISDEIAPMIFKNFYCFIVK